MDILRVEDSFQILYFILSELIFPVFLWNYRVQTSKVRNDIPPPSHKRPFLYNIQMKERESFPPAEIIEKGNPRHWIEYPIKRISRFSLWLHYIDAWRIIIIRFTTSSAVAISSIHDSNFPVDLLYCDDGKVD